MTVSYKHRASRVRTQYRMLRTPVPALSANSAGGDLQSRQERASAAMLFDVRFGFWRRQSQPPVAEPECCSGSTWTMVADFGHGAGFDFDLGKCSVCGNYLIRLTYGPWANLHRVREKRANYYLYLHKKHPDRLRSVLRKWADG